MSDKQKKHFIMEYQKRFKVCTTDSRERETSLILNCSNRHKFQKRAHQSNKRVPKKKSNKKTHL